MSAQDARGPEDPNALGQLHVEAAPIEGGTDIVEVSPPHHGVSVVGAERQACGDCVGEGETAVRVCRGESSVRRKLRPALVPPDPALLDGKEVAETEEYRRIEGEV